jgi:hypothetical protein
MVWAGARPIVDSRDQPGSHQAASGAAGDRIDRANREVKRNT